MMALETTQNTDHPLCLICLPVPTQLSFVNAASAWARNLR